MSIEENKIQNELNKLYIKKYDAQRVLNADQNYISSKTHNKLLVKIWSLTDRINNLNEKLSKKE